MRTENLAIDEFGVGLYEFGDMRFDEVFLFLDDLEVDDAAREYSSFNEYPFAVRPSGESDSAISDLVYLDVIENFHGWI